MYIDLNSFKKTIKPKHSFLHLLYISSQATSYSFYLGFSKHVYLAFYGLVSAATVSSITGREARSFFWQTLSKYQHKKKWDFSLHKAPCLKLFHESPFPLQLSRCPLLQVDLIIPSAKELKFKKKKGNKESTFPL